VSRGDREVKNKTGYPSRIRREGLLDGDFVSSLLQTHLRNQRDNRKQLWTLLVWELWSDRYHPTL